MAAMDPAMAIEVASMSRGRAVDAAAARGDSDVQRFYAGCVVFITGGSGFLGKQLIEKLFRSCNISKAYILLRPKKNKNIQERLNEMLKDPVFNSVRQKNQNFSDKIVAVKGDVSELLLGMSREDWETMTKQVNVIFHVAATTKFDETLRVATLINVRGTREMLLLGKECKNLKSYVHVSTAYTHATTKFVDKEIEEKFYESPVPPEAIISMAENMDPDRLISITNDLIKDWPNTYTFTKSISEELVRTASSGLPICIVRPGVVLCTHQEPVPGWLDLSCVYGASGLVLGCGLGVLHTSYFDFHKKLGFVPCDYVNNVIIVAGRETATNQAKGGSHTRIYTVSSTQKNPIKSAKLIDVVAKKAINFPTEKAIYYNFGFPTSNKFLFMILSLFLQIIPAYIADFVCLLIGKQRRFTKLAKKAYKMTNTLSYFLRNEWNFMDKNLDKLFSSLSAQDKIIFNFDVTKIDWTEYIIIWCLGVRKYILNDGLKFTEYAVRKQKYLRVVHYFLMTLYIYGIWKCMQFILHIIVMGYGLFSELL